MENGFETKETHPENAATPEPAGRAGSTLPVAVTLVALLIWFGFQTADLVIERNQLTTVKSNYDVAVQDAEKMQRQLQTLITQTNELAGKGNANAKAVIEELKKRGISPPPSAPPGK